MQIKPSETVWIRCRNTTLRKMCLERWNIKWFCRLQECLSNNIDRYTLVTFGGDPKFASMHLNVYTTDVYIINICILWKPTRDFLFSIFCDNLIVAQPCFLPHWTECLTKDRLIDIYNDYHPQVWKWVYLQNAFAIDWQVVNEFTLLSFIGHSPCFHFTKRNVDRAKHKSYARVYVHMLVII